MAITNNVFYPNTFTPDEQRAIRQSVLWPLISGFHYKTNGALFLSKIVYNDADQMRVVMCVADGWPVLRLHKRASEANYCVAVLSATDSELHEVASTSNASYILKRINDRKQTKKRGKKYPLGHTLHTAIEQWTRVSPQPASYGMLEYVARLFAYTMRDKMPSRESVKLTAAAQWEAVRIAMGDATVESMSDNVQTELKNAHRAIQRRDEMLTATSETITDMFSADRCKWMLAYRGAYGYVAMKFRPTKLAEWCNNYVFPDDARCPDIMPCDIDIVEPFTYYSTLQALPPALAAEILPRLNFAKVNRTGTGIAADPDGFIHAGQLLQERIGCVTRPYNGYYVMIFDA